MAARYIIERQKTGDTATHIPLAPLEVGRLSCSFSSAFCGAHPFGVL